MSVLHTFCVDTMLLSVRGVVFAASYPQMFSLLLVTLYGVFTNHSCMGVATRCLLLELLDVSVSDLLVRGSSSTQGGR